MVVRLKLFATLGRFASGKLPGTPMEYELPEGATLEVLVKQLELPEDEVKICFVNGRQQEPDFALHQGDEVGIFPPIGGGCNG